MQGFVPTRAEVPFLFLDANATPEILNSFKGNKRAELDWCIETVMPGVWQASEAENYGIRITEADGSSFVIWTEAIPEEGRFRRINYTEEDIIQEELEIFQHYISLMKISEDAKAA